MKISDLTEGRDAPLYHGTDARAAEMILALDTINGITWQELKTKNLNKDLRGVSLTRDIRVARKFPGHGSNEVIFVFDQRKLAQRYKIMPLDYFTTNPEGQYDMLHHWIPAARRRDTFAEAEEFIVGDITKVHKYLTEVIITAKVNMDAHIELEKELQELSDLFNIKITDETR